MSKNLLRRIIIFLLSALLLMATILLAGPTAAAQARVQRRVVIVRPIRRPRFYDPFWQPYPYGRFNEHRQYVFSNGDAAYNQGYKEGLKTGQTDAHKEKSYDPERSHYFHDAGFGNFAEAYREGFTRGYRDGYGSRGVG